MLDTWRCDYNLTCKLSQTVSVHGETEERQRDYIYLNGQLVARVSSVASEGIQYVINDHLGAPMALVDSAKTIRWRAKWYPFGEIYDEFVSVTNDVRFPGQLRDEESGLYYNWHRYYSPELGRYYQADPMGLRGGDYNLYRYAIASPTRNVDLDGTFSFEKVLASMPTLPHWFVNGSAGFGDVLLGGFGDELREAFGAEGVVNRCSKAYHTGEVLGYVVDAATGLRGGSALAGTKSAATEFSHFIPKRWLKKVIGRDIRNRLNGNYMTPARHTLLDKFRYLKGMTAEDKFGFAQKVIFRFPRAPLGTAIGAGWGLSGILDEDCKCKKK